MPKYQTTIIDSFEKITRSNWNDLVQSSPTNTIFQTYDWNKVVWDTFLKEHQLIIVIVRIEEQIVGIAPMYLVNEDPGPVVQFISGRKGDYSDFIYESSSVTVLSEMLRVLKEYSFTGLIRLEKIPADSVTLEYLSKFKFVSTNTHCVDCPSFRLNVNPAEAKKLIYKRKEPSYKKRLLARQGDYEVRHLKDWESVKEYLPAFYTMHIKQWAVTDTPSVFRESEQRLFESMLRELDGTGWALLSVCLLDDIPVSIHIGFIYGDRFVWYKPTYDIELYRYSPGQVLMHECMDYAYKNKMSEFDFAAGNEQFKHIYANHIGSNRTITIYPGKLYRMRLYTRTKLSKNRVSAITISSYSKVVQYIKKNGILKLVRRSAENAGKFLFQVTRLEVFILDKNEDIGIKAARKANSFTIQKAEISDFYNKSPFPPGKERDDLYKSAYWRIRKKKETAYIALKDDVIAAYAWILEDDHVYSPELERMIEKVEEGTIVLTKNCWTHPDYRNQGAYSSLLTYIINEYTDRQRIVYCDRENQASSRVIRKIYRFHKGVMGIKLFGKKLDLFQPVPGE